MSTRIVVGRFQVPKLTAAHIQFLAKAMPQVILLGVSPLDQRDARTPFSFDSRVAMVRRDYFASSIHPIFDNPSDAVWSKQLDHFVIQLYGSQVELIGGRDSFLKRYCGKLKTLEIPPISAVSGTECREAVYPKHDAGFMEGQAYTLCHAYARVHATVDVGVFDVSNLTGDRVEAHGPHILLIQRADTGEWCLPGGFADPTDDSFEAAAKRELWEEVGIDLEVSSFHYAGTHKVHDWRYRSSKDKVITTLFTTQKMWGGPRTTDEVTDFHWLPRHRALEQVAPVHYDLVKACFDRRQF